ncbi:dihydropteridine reductase [Cystoisospora suis]|uniref:Dihydropteridine reductase n=1 Tax=Cystoisospora suis TaxID=483139 RepID=A0A2C6LFC2_9APIC|nr:dihydropteridine reductase [Cystoisospora suis]
MCAAAALKDFGRRSVLLFGSTGALGSAVADAFARANWRVIGCSTSGSSRKGKDTSRLQDLPGCSRAAVTPSPSHAFIEVKGLSTLSLREQGDEILKQLQPLLATGPLLHAIICCSGAFACSPVESAEFLSEAQHLVRANCYPSMLCAHVAATLFNSQQEKKELPSPLVVLTGAAAVSSKTPTPSMIAYGCSKAYVHHLVRSLAAVASAKAAGDTAERGERAGPFRVVGILPEMLDTPANRASMPDVSAEQRSKTWTEPKDIAEKLLRWADGVEEATNGGIYVVRTREGQTQFVRRCDE